MFGGHDSLVMFAKGSIVKLHAHVFTVRSCPSQKLGLFPNGTLL